MKFTPLSEEELKSQQGTLAPGRGNFEIQSVEEKVSKSGNDMLKLTLKVWDQNGREGYIYDYIVATAQWKIKQLLESVGCLYMYERGDIDTFELTHKAGDCEIAIQKAESKDYSDRAIIKAYRPAESDAAEPVNVSKSLPKFDAPNDLDDIAF